MKMNFICKEFNKNNTELKGITQEKRKAAKLTPEKRNINRTNACGNVIYFKVRTT